MPPTGQLRFAPAQLAPFNESTFRGAGSSWRVGRFGPRCMQRGGYGYTGRPQVCTQDASSSAQHCINEDCLFLNIAVPNASLPTTSGGAGTAAPVPVLVWIHGGGWTAGAGKQTHAV